MRTGRGKVAGGAEVKPGVEDVKSGGGIHLFGARAGAGVILFDTGADPDGKPIDGLLARLGASRPDVREVFLTHGHYDHVSGVASLAPGVRIFLGAADVDLAAGIAAPEAIASKVLTAVMGSRTVKVTDLLTGQQTIPVDGGKVVKAFPVPGHTAGSYAFLYDGVLFVGDIMILKEGKLELTPGIFDPHPEQNRASIRTLLTQLGGDSVQAVCTAHGGCTPTGFGRKMLEDFVARLGS